MSQTALQRLGAELAQSSADHAALLTEEARRLTDCAAQFALFGLRIGPIDMGEAPQTLQSGEISYLTSQGSTEAPANDLSAQRCLPTLTHRGVHIDPRLPGQFARALDWVAVAVAAEVAARWGEGESLAGLDLGAAAVFVVCALCLKVGMWLTESYCSTPARARAERGLGGLTLGTVLGVILANLFAPDVRSAGALSATLPFVAMTMACLHAALAIWTRTAHRAGLFAETVLLVGATDAATRLAERAAKTGDARIVAIVDDRLARAPHVAGGVVVGGNLDAALAWEGLPYVDRIVVALPQKAEARVGDVIERLRNVPNRVDLLLDFQNQSIRGRRFDRLGGSAVASISGRPHNGRRALVKRCQDMIIGGALAALLAPLFLTIAALIKLDSRGPVFTRVRRYGLNNRTIETLQFRATHQGDGATTRIGAMLRNSGLKDLPMLLSVLRGDLSLVGPLPHPIGVKAAKRDYAHIIPEYAHRHRVKPGVVGWAQINGAYDLNTPVTVRKHVRLDLEYVARASLWFDLQILVRAVPSVVGLRGAQALTD